MLDDCTAVSPDPYRKSIIGKEIGQPVSEKPLHCCPFIGISEFQSNSCMEKRCMFWNEESCILEKAAYALSIQARYY